MSHIFISYSRKDIDFAGRIVQALGENDFDTWIDWKSIPKGEDWLQEIYRGIEEADAFLFLVSKDSVASEPCNLEVAHAVKNGKRILPVFITNVDNKEVYNVTGKFIHKEVEEEINRRNFIFCREEKGEFKKAVDEIKETIRTNYDWLKYHTSLQVKALEWERAKDKSHLLGGKQLDDAEKRLINADKYEPEPTGLQREYVLESRKQVVRSRNQFTYGAVAVAVVLLIATLIALTQRSAAVRQADVSQSLALSAYAQNALLQDDQDLALSLAVEAAQIQDPPGQSAAVLSQIAFAPGTRRSMDVNEAGVFRVRYNQDGTLILSVSGDGDIQLWDALSGAEIYRLGDHDRPESDISDPLVPGITFTPDERMAISAGGEDIRFWNLESGELVRKIYLGDRLGFGAAAFSEDARYLLWGSNDGSLHFMDLEDGREIWKSTDEHTAAVGGVAINADSSRALSGGNEGKVVLWDTVSGEKMREFGIQAPKMITGEYNVAHFNVVAFSPDGKNIAGATAEGAVEIWDIDTGENLLHINADGSIFSVQFSRDGQKVLLGTGHGIEIWDLYLGQKSHSLSGHSDWVFDVGYRPDEKRLVSASKDGTIRIWDIVSDASIELRGHTSNVTKLSTTQDGNALLSSSWDGSLRLWDVNTGLETQRIKSDKDLRYSSADISPDGKFVIAGSAAGIAVYEIDSGRELLWIDEPDILLPTAIGFIPTKEQFYSVGLHGSQIGLDAPDSTIRIWNTRTGELEAELFNQGISEAISAVATSSDGRLIVSANNQSSVMSAGLETGSIINIWDLDSQEKVMEIPLEYVDGMLVSLALSPDSEFIYAGLMQGEILAFEMKSGQLVNRISGQTGIILALAVSPDGKYLASAAEDKTVRILETNEFGEIGSFTMDSQVRTLLFEGNGSSLFAGTEDGVIHIWSISPSIENTLTWISQNRYVRELTCLERQQYGAYNQCDKDGNLPASQLLNDEGGNAASTPVPLVSDPSNQDIGDTNSNDLATTRVVGTYEDEAHFWQFEAQAGDMITLQLASEQFDPYLILKDEDWNIVSVNDDSEPGLSNNATIRELQIDRTGTYTIVVDRFLDYLSAGRGAYILSITVRSPSNGSSHELKQLPVGKFGMGFGWLEDGSLRVSGIVKGSPAYEAGLLPGDTIVGLNDMEAGTFNRRQVWDVLRNPIGGRVSLSVRRNEHVSSLSLIASPPVDDVYLNQNVVQLGRKYSAKLPAGQTAYWVLEGNAEQNIAVTVGGIRSILGSMKIYSSDQTILHETSRLDDEIGWLLYRWNAIEPLFTLPEDDTYYIGVSNDGKIAGDDYYSFSVQTLVDQGKLQASEHVEGELSATEGFIWKFDGRKGQILSFNFELHDSLIEPMFFMIDPDNTWEGGYALQGFDKFGMEYNIGKLPKSIYVNGYPLPKTGEYTIVILPYLRTSPVRKTGTYGLTLKVADIAIDRMLASGEQYETNLSLGELKIFGYEGKQGEKIRITVTAETPASDVASYFDAVDENLLDVLLVVSDGNGEVLELNHDYGDTTNSQVEVELPADGMYYFEVGTEKYFGEGNITISVEKME